MIRTTAALPKALHRRLMVASVETRLVATEIIRRALAEWLDRRQRKGRRGGKE
jgi:predicted cobalt transporter CbtA